MSSRPCLSAILLVGTTLLSSACAIRPELDIVVHESDRGAVYIERMPDRSLQAAHPIALSTEMMARVLRGVLVKDHQRILQSLIAGEPDVVRVFGEDDIAYLAPLLADGLTRASSDQQIGFRLARSGSPNPSQPVETQAAPSPTAVRLKPTESTKGTVYAYGRSLYVTLTEYHLRSERADATTKGSRRALDPTGLATRTVDFTPTAAKRPNSYRQAHSTDATLVIDYELLTRLPAETTPPVAALPQPSTTPQASPPTAETPTQKTSEIEALRKELEEIKRQLSEQASERTWSQPKKAIPQK